MLLARVGRSLLLLVLVTAGTITLVRYAPGYFSNTAEMSAQYGESARTQIEQDQAQQGSAGRIAGRIVSGWLHADLGQSRHYEVPVTTLLRPRLWFSFWLMLRAILAGWLLAFTAALALTATGLRRTFLSVPFTILLAVPTGAMATLCLLSDSGGPLLVLSLLIAARDFKFLERLLLQQWQATHLLQARAQGMTVLRMIRAHILPASLPQMRSLATMSVITALSAIVPVEVIFDSPGVGQLAWTAATNRDLPVLLAVTLLMAAVILCAGALGEEQALVELA